MTDDTPDGGNELSRRNVLVATGTFGAGAAIAGAGLWATDADGRPNDHDPGSDDDDASASADRSTGGGDAGDGGADEDEEEAPGNTLLAGDLDLRIAWQQTYEGPDGHVPVNAYPPSDDDPRRQAKIESRDAIAREKYGTDYDELTDDQRRAVESAFRQQFADLEEYFGHRKKAKPALIDLPDVKPGDEGRVKFGLHLFDNPGWIWMGGRIRSELGPLADAVQVRIRYSKGSQGTIAKGSLREALEKLETGIPIDGDTSTTDRDCFENSVTRWVVFEWWIPTTVGNEIQGDSVKFDLSFFAQQCRHNEDPANPYTKDKKSDT